MKAIEIEVERNVDIDVKCSPYCEDNRANGE